jgi:hypothetical protein
MTVLIIDDEPMLRGLPFDASFRWVFRFGPGEGGATHELKGEKLLVEFQSVVGIEDYCSYAGYVL